MGKADILIENGRVLDPASGFDGVRTVAVRNGKIIEAAPGMEAAHAIDAGGCYVFPGMIDFHTHIMGGASNLALASPELFLSTGVTAAVDAGTAGCINYPVLHRTVQSSLVKIRAYLLVNSVGQVCLGQNEPADPALYDRDAIRRMFGLYPDELIGLKVRLGKPVVGGFGTKPLEEALRIAEELGVPVCVHATDPSCTCSELVSMLRAGDVFAHVFHGTGETILDRNGDVHPEVLRAKKRGVLFDLANGKTNFDLGVARKALARGFYPDILSTDMTCDKQFVPPYAKDQPSILSKLVSMGMPLREAVRAVTETPARAMGMRGRIGTLAPGACADVAVMRLKERSVTYRDFSGAEWTAGQVFVPQMTIADGSIVFCQTDFYV